MGITGFNVFEGLNSFYIIRNNQSEKDLPSKNYEKLVYIYGNFAESQLMRDCSKEC